MKKIVKNYRKLDEKLTEISEKGRKLIKNHDIMLKNM